ncbi:MAG: MFS transporter [Candidatus Dormibacteria bacterium]
MRSADPPPPTPPERSARGWRRLAVEPARPAAIRDSPNAAWLVVGSVCIGAFMGQLDASIVVIALPTMQVQLHSSLGGVEWIPLAYLLALVGCVTAVGRFSDMVGHKLIYIYGFGIFILGSLLCGLAPNLPALIGFRLLQGLGAALLQANSVALIVQSVPAAKLGKAIGVQGAAQALGLSLGPAIGGWLLVLGGWRLIFLVNIPAGALGMVLGWFLLPRSHHLSLREPLDWLGMGLFVIAAGSLLLGLSSGNQWGWVSLPSLGCFVVAAGFGTAFVLAELHVSAPMMRMATFRRIPFSAGIGSGLLSYLTLFGTLFVFPYYLRFAGHMDPAQAGLRLLALPLALGVTAPLAGQVADRIGARPLTVGGMLLVSADLVAIAVHPSLGLLLLLELVLLGIGLGAFTPANNAAIMGAVPRQQSGMASGILNMTRGLGTATGVATAGLIFGLATGTSVAHTRSPHLVAAGLVAAAILLAVTAALAALVAALRGRAPLNSDPAMAPVA